MPSAMPHSNVTRIHMSIFFSEPSNGGSSTIHNRRASSLRMEEERHWSSMSDQGQQQTVLFLPYLLLIPQDTDMGT